MKTYECKSKDGTIKEEKFSWFGYKLHLIVDAIYELPIGYEVTKASRPDNTVGGRLIENKKKEARKAEQEDRQLPSIRSLVRAA